MGFLVPIKSPTTTDRGKKEKEKKKIETEENSKNCKSPSHRQRFMITIKNVTGEKNKKPKSLIVFLNGNKIDNYNRGGKKGKKRRRNPEESTEQVKT